MIHCETTLALDPASDKNPSGKVELGFTVADVEAFYRDMSANSVPGRPPLSEGKSMRGWAFAFSSPESAVLLVDALLSQAQGRNSFTIPPFLAREVPC